MLLKMPALSASWQARLLISVLLVLVVGCGFKLRGIVPFPSWLTKVYITPDEPYELLQKELRRIFNRNKVIVVTEIDANTVVLKLISPVFKESILALNANGQAQMFRLEISLQYQLIYADKALVPITTIYSSKNFSLAPEQILSGENERQLIKDELLQDAINQLLQQLSAVTLVK